MFFLHLCIFPAVVIIISMLLHNYFDRKEFVQFFLIYIYGIITGLLLSILFSFLNTFYEGSAHYITVLFQSLIVKGLVFSFIAALALFIIFEKLVSMSLTTTWTMTGIMSFIFLSGIYSVLNMIEAFSGNCPDTPLHYLSLLPFVMTLALIIGFGLPKFIDSYRILYKILWAFVLVSILTVMTMAYSFLIYYKYYFHYFNAVFFVVLFTIFEIYDFRYFRHRSYK